MRLLLAALLLAGCAIAHPITVQKGGDGNGNYLAIGMLLRHSGAVIACRGENVYACMMTNQFVPWGTTMIDQFYLIVDGGHMAGFTEKELEIMVHEACHYVADVQHIIPDPCHNEDHGVIP